MLVAATLAACAQAPQAGPTLQARLVGLWCNSDDGGRSCWAWDEFRPDGTLHMCGRHDGDAQPFSAVAQVSFSGDRMCYRVLRSSANFWLGAGQSYCTQIVDVQPQAHTYRDLDSGALFTLLRRPLAARGCPA